MTDSDSYTQPEDIFAGIDIGSTTIKLVLLDTCDTLLEHRYQRTHGQPTKILKKLLEELRMSYDLSHLGGVGLTGSGGAVLSQAMGLPHINELIAQTYAVGSQYPQAHTIIEIGGQDSKLLLVRYDEQQAQLVLQDFVMNTLCAAGTGAFLDQQAERLSIAIEKEFEALALQSTQPAQIAGRCTVFTKSDMIHLQQEGVPLPDILAGLCLALARNFKSIVGRGKRFMPPVVIQGGVAQNQAVVRAFSEVLNIPLAQLIVPQPPTLMAAIGTAMLARINSQLKEYYDLNALLAQFEASQSELTNLPALKRRTRTPYTNRAGHNKMSTRDKLYLGVDVGSISIKIVAINEDLSVIAERNLLNTGRPLKVLKRGLREIGSDLNGTHIRGAGITGSGRHYLSVFLGADLVINEISAQARAAMTIDPTVDTVFEIGGQDSKYIRLHQGAVIDFTMNNACGAGTGVFLEEQANRLEINLEQDFSDLAFNTPGPVGLGNRCTVFMESDLVHYQQQGTGLEALSGGLAYAIANHYLNRVVDRRSIGQRIMFQGGVASNDSVVAAFEHLLAQEITVPPHSALTGAIGAAILAKEKLADGSQQTTFRGFNLEELPHTSQSFICRACPNMCDVQRVKVNNDRPVFFGARCDKFDHLRSIGGKHPDAVRHQLPDLFDERNRLLLGKYVPVKQEHAHPLTITIPRALIFYELYPYWQAFFDTLGIAIHLSSPTSAKTLHLTAEHAAVDACFPVKLFFGHAVEILDRDADYMLLPSVANRENKSPEQRENNYCPLVVSTPHIIATQFDFTRSRQQPLRFPVHMLWPATARRQLTALTRQLKRTRAEIHQSIDRAEYALRAFQASMIKRGQEILSSTNNGRPIAVIVGRSYNTCDQGACQHLPNRLRQMGVLPMPMDFLPLADIDFSNRYDNMYWYCGQAILSAAEIIHKDPRLQVIYVTNPNCGPDSFLLSYFRKIMGDKPFLELELDDHTAEAGIQTRCEAFFSSLPRTREVLVE